MKLDSGQKHFLTLIHRDKKKDGWTSVSKAVLPLVYQMPEELREVETLENGTGRVRLTVKGQEVHDAMAWL